MDCADWAEYMTGRTRADGADSLANRADWRTGRSLSYSTGRTGRNIGLGRLGRTGRTVGQTGQVGGSLADWRTGRTKESWTGRTGVDGADWGRRADSGGLGRWGGGERMGRTGRTRRRGVWSRLGNPEAGVPADWADRLGCTRPG